MSLEDRETRQAEKKYEEQRSDLEEEVSRVAGILVELERSLKELDERVSVVEERVDEVLPVLYELATNSINPFVETLPPVAGEMQRGYDGG